MPGVIRPPWGAPTGPELSDAELVRTFVHASRTGHSPSFHIEDMALLAERFVTVAIRCGASTTVLVRNDADTHGIGEGLHSAGISLQVREPELAVVVGLQVSGLPAAVWDLWGRDAKTALEDLERTAAGPPLSAVGDAS